jgi:hypothetical protein
MNVIPLIIMVLLLIAALERNHRGQPPTPPGLHGSNDHDDRDWARIELDLLALGDRAEIVPRKPHALKHSRLAPPPFRARGSAIPVRESSEERRRRRTTSWTASSPNSTSSTTR